MQCMDDLQQKQQENEKRLKIKIKIFATIRFLIWNRNGPITIYCSKNRIIASSWSQIIKTQTWQKRIKTWTK